MDIRILIPVLIDTAYGVYKSIIISCLNNNLLWNHYPNQKQFQHVCFWYYVAPQCQIHKIWYTKKPTIPFYFIKWLITINSFYLCNISQLQRWLFFLLHIIMLLIFLKNEMTVWACSFGWTIKICSSLLLSLRVKFLLHIFSWWMDCYKLCWQMIKQTSLTLSYGAWWHVNINETLSKCTMWKISFTLKYRISTTLLCGVEKKVTFVIGWYCINRNYWWLLIIL